MLDLLSRFKRDEWPFEMAWDRAWRGIRWPDKREPRDEWKDVIRSGRSTWEGCYLDEGAPIDITAVVDALSRETDQIDLTLVA